MEGEFSEKTNKHYASILLFFYIKFVFLRKILNLWGKYVENFVKTYPFAQKTKLLVVII